MVARSRSRISAAVTSCIGRGSFGVCSAIATARARVAGQVLHQPLLVFRVALAARYQIRIDRDEGEIEQLGVGFLLGVDALLLVSRERGGALDAVEGLAREECLAEDVVDVHVVMAIQSL